jgi:hypothetical protein
MRGVIVETLGEGVRTIQVGREKKPKKVEPTVMVGLISSPRISPHTGADNKPTDTKCWKTPKKGEPKPKKCWQRHGERKPSRRRNRWGRIHCSYPSVRILNEKGLCIYPYTDAEEMDFWESGKAELLEELLNIE